MMSFVKALQCRECIQGYPKEPLHVCETCFGPLEIVYDYDAIANSIKREKIAAREKNLWRYRELLDEEIVEGIKLLASSLEQPYTIEATLEISISSISI